MHLNMLLDTRWIQPAAETWTDLKAPGDDAGLVALAAREVLM